MSLDNTFPEFTAALERLTASMPEHVQRKWAEEDAKRHELCEAIRTNCYDALEDITTAMRRPVISQTYLESAIAKLVVALDCSKGLES